jgi:Holliday junction DNA helicase RuvB
VEPYLMQIGLLARTSRGRQLTDSGWRHLGLVPPAGASAAAQPGLFD